MKPHDAYAEVQRELDAALATENPTNVAAACTRATLRLARIAASEGFDRARHRAIQGALRSLERQVRATAPIAPLTSR